MTMFTDDELRVVQNLTKALTEFQNSFAKYIDMQSAIAKLTTYTPSSGGEIEFRFNPRDMKGTEDDLKNVMFVREQMLEMGRKQNEMYVVGRKKAD